MIVWFMCKCGSTFLKLEQYISHKKKNHLEEYRKSKCIVFAEKIIEENIDEDSDSDSGPTNNATNSISTPILSSTSSKTETKPESKKPAASVGQPLFLPIDPEPEPESKFAFQQEPQAGTAVVAEIDPLAFTTQTTKSRASIDLSDPDDANSLTGQKIKTEPLENSDEDFESFEASSSPVNTLTEANVRTVLTTFETDEEEDSDSDSRSSEVFHVPSVSTPQVLVRRLSPRQTQQAASSKLNVEKKSKRGPIKKQGQPVLCDICGLTFRIKSDLLEHKSVHRGPSRVIQWVEKGSFSSQEEADLAITHKWKIQYTYNGAFSKRVTYYCREDGIHCPVKVQLVYPVEKNSSGGGEPGNSEAASSLSKEPNILFLESPCTEHKRPEGKEKALSEPIKERMRRLMEQGITGALRMLKTLDIQHNAPTLMQIRNFISRYKHLYDPKSIAKFKSGKIKAPPGSAKLKPRSEFESADFSNETVSTL